MSAIQSILFSFVATVLCVSAQSAAASPPVAAAPNASQPADGSAITAEKLHVAQAKLARMQQVADRFAGEAATLGYADNTWRFELVNHLMRADPATVGRVETSADLRAALQAAAVPSAQAQSLGDATSDLIYVPIAPCRIVDTRNSGAGGNFASHEARTYTYQGGAAQGGATCTFTAGATPAALAVNVTVVSSGLGNDPTAFGFLSVYPEGGSRTSSWMNYLGSDTKANAGIAAITQSSGNFSVFAQNPTHVIIDLFGVFRAATDGTPNFIAKWDGAGTLGTSSVWDGGAGRIGIGTTTPTHSLEFLGNYPQIQLDEVNGRTATLSRYTDRFEITASDVFQVSAGAGGTADLFVAANHDVGIGTGAPASRLQVGSVGSSGYSGNDIAFGNGTQASGIAQLADHAQWYSTTSIALMPGNGSGRVGVNTTAPAAPLDVEGYVTFPSLTYNYFNGGANLQAGFISPNISIIASDNIRALEFDALSVSRIKDIVGASDRAKDLDTLNAIEVTDYTLKDKVRNGNRPFKKIIAQQVEGVYPQVVHWHTDFIPNVYRSADSVESVSTGDLLRFTAPHGLSANAKRIKLLVEGEDAMRKVDVLAMPSEREVIVDARNLEGSRIFVYGEEVDDFRTVDYEGLTTLNISATQELSRRLAQKDSEIAALRAELAAQKLALSDLADLKAQFAQYRRDTQATSRLAQAKP